MSIRFVLFDIGRVVLDWEPDRLYRTLIPDAGRRAHFLTHICTMDWHINHDAGISFADNAAQLIAIHPEFEAEIRAWGERWMGMFDGYIDGTPDLMMRLKSGGIPLFALTNMPSETWPMMQAHFPIMAEFEDVIVSGDEKCVKPGEEIFRISLARMGHPAPETILFVDDSQANIDAAHALGFETHHFTGAQRLETDLIDRKLI